MKTLLLATKKIITERPAFIMGIVNANNDSFWKKSRGGNALALSLIKQGADILDIGSESTRPGAKYISAQEEIKNIIPIIKKVRKVSDIPISIDTRKKDVMCAAFNEGADILNDVSALEDDEMLGKFCANKKIPVILMHKRGNPDIMQNNVDYKDVFIEVSSYLKARALYAMSLGIAENKIIVDPGIGFGKNLFSNQILIKRCGELCNSKFPVLMGLSRKSCIGEMTSRNTEKRLYGTLCANVISVLCGASIIRVHDVTAALDTMNVLKGVMNAGTRSTSFNL